MADAGALRVIHTSRAKVNTIEQKYGQLIIVEDARQIIFDGDERTIYQQVITLSTDEIRRGTTPIPGAFYFVRSTCIIWTSEDGEWIQVTSTPKDQIVFEDKSQFPVVGESNMLYVSSNEIYRYLNGEYVICGSNSDAIWEEL